MLALALAPSLAACVQAPPRRESQRGPVAIDRIEPAPDRVADLGDSALDPPAPRACDPWNRLAAAITQRHCTPGRGHVVIAMAGWRITGDSTQRWLDALAAARLDALETSAYFAVEGPRAVDYRDKEIALDALLATVTADLAADGWALVIAHSSGAHVARALFHRAAAHPALRGRFVYVDLDGDQGIRSDPERRFTERSASVVRHALFVAAEDRARRLRGFSPDAMREGAAYFGARGALFVYDARDAGCTSDACAHLSLINTRPYPRGNESYARFEQGPVNTSWLDRIAPALTRGAAP